MDQNLFKIFDNKKFDFINYCHVFEHLNDPISELKRLKDLISDDMLINEKSQMIETEIQKEIDELGDLSKQITKLKKQLQPLQKKYNEVMKNHINYGNQKEEETIEPLTEPKILDMLDVTDVLGNKVEITPEIKEFISKLNLTRKVDHFGSKNRMKTNEELFMDKLLENA